MASIKKKNKPETSIPTASMADIAFLLLLFFMVSTVFVKEQIRKVVMPKADEQIIMKVDRTKAQTIYIEKAQTASDRYTYWLNDEKKNVMEVAEAMERKVQDEADMTTALRVDSEAEYGRVFDLMKNLQKVNARKLNFETKKRL